MVCLTMGLACIKMEASHSAVGEDSCEISPRNRKDGKRKNEENTTTSQKFESLVNLKSFIAMWEAIPRPPDWLP
jgi:hypothetical protein